MFDEKFVNWIKSELQGWIDMLINQKRPPDLKIVAGQNIPQTWLFRKGIIEVFGYKSPDAVLKQYVQFCDRHPRFYGEFKPYLDIEGQNRMFNIYCFAYYFEHRDLLESGTKWLKFSREEAERISRTYLIERSA